jgi:hypothetical protein
MNKVTQSMDALHVWIEKPGCALKSADDLNWVLALDWMLVPRPEANERAADSIR